MTVAERTTAQHPEHGAVALPLSGRRLHLQHGPIDLIVHAWGEAAAVRPHIAQRSVDLRMSCLN